MRVYLHTIIDLLKCSSVVVFKVWLWSAGSRCYSTCSTEEALCWRHCIVFRDWIPLGLHLLGSQVKLAGSWSREGLCHLSIPMAQGQQARKYFSFCWDTTLGLSLNSWASWELDQPQRSTWPTVQSPCKSPDVSRIEQTLPEPVHKWAGATRATQSRPLSQSPGTWVCSAGLCHRSLSPHQAERRKKTVLPRFLEKPAIADVPCLSRGATSLLQRSSGEGAGGEEAAGTHSRAASFPREGSAFLEQFLPLVMASRSGTGICEEPRCGCQAYRSKSFFSDSFHQKVGFSQIQGEERLV